MYGTSVASRPMGGGVSDVFSSALDEPNPFASFVGSASPSNSAAFRFFEFGTMIASDVRCERRLYEAIDVRACPRLDFKAQSDGDAVDATNSVVVDFPATTNSAKAKIGLEISRRTMSH